MKKILLIITILIISMQPQFNYGMVLNQNGDGILLDYKTKQPIHPCYNYIKYENYHNFGENVITICLLKPFSKYNDDIICRIDFYKNNTNIKLWY